MKNWFHLRHSPSLCCLLLLFAASSLPALALYLLPRRWVAAGALLLALFFPGSGMHTRPLSHFHPRPHRQPFQAVPTQLSGQHGSAGQPFASPAARYARR